MSADSDKVLTDYTAARRAAGTIGDGMAAWKYWNGWYSIGHGKYRRAQVLEMTANLQERAAKRREGDDQS